MDIAFAFDETYADHAQVAVESVLETHGHRTDITFWLLTTPAVVKERGGALRRQADGRAGLRLLSTGDEYRDLPLADTREWSWLGYLSTGMYLRLLLPDLVDADLDRLLYLDVDVHVCGDLSPLWELPLPGDVPLAAVRDAYTPTIGAQGGVPGAGDEHGPQSPYFNSGVLLMHLPAWRRQDVSGRSLDYLTRHAGGLRFPDQDALNLAAYGRWLRLPHRWNHMRSYDLQHADGTPVDGTDARIMHFAGERKPWSPGFRPGFRLDRHRRLARQVAAYA